MDAGFLTIVKFALAPDIRIVRISGPGHEPEHNNGDERREQGEDHDQA
jgi:hypothetical protein